MEDLNNCGFQYYDGCIVKEDVRELTLDEAKELFNNYYVEMVSKVNEGYEIEVAIWIDMSTPNSYGDTLLHLSSPVVENGKLCEKITKFYPKFNG